MHIGPTPPPDGGQNARSSTEDSLRTFIWGIVIIGLLLATWVGWVVIFNSDQPEPGSSSGPNSAVTLILEIA